MGASYTKKLEKTYIDLSITSKHMNRESRKREQESKKSRKLVETYMKKNEMEVAKIHAENSIRQKSESVKYLRLSARLDAVAQKVRSAISQQQMSDNMKNVVSNLSGVLESMDVEKISNTMEQFESQFETLDVRTKFMDSAISNTTATATPQDEVTGLMNQVGENIGIQVSAELDSQGLPVTVPLGGTLTEKPMSKVALEAEGADTGSGGGATGKEPEKGTTPGDKTTKDNDNLSDLQARFNRLRDDD